MEIISISDCLYHVVNILVGVYLNIYVLPRILKFDILDDAVEVYDACEKNETYGWLHRDPWEQDFEEFVEYRRTTYDERAAKAAADAEAERMRILASTCNNKYSS